MSSKEYLGDGVYAPELDPGNGQAHERPRYLYLGDRFTDRRLVGQPCNPVRNARGKCVAARGKALVVFPWGEVVVVLRRRLRLTSKVKGTNASHASGGH
jgi:hypothetical protein